MRGVSVGETKRSCAGSSMPRPRVSSNELAQFSRSFPAAHGIGRARTGARSRSRPSARQTRYTPARDPYPRERTWKERRSAKAIGAVGRNPVRTRPARRLRVHYPERGERVERRLNDVPARPPAGTRAGLRHRRASRAFTLGEDPACAHALVGRARHRSQRVHRLPPGAAVARVLQHAPIARGEVGVRRGWPQLYRAPARAGKDRFSARSMRSPYARPTVESLGKRRRAASPSASPAAGASHA